MIRAYILYILTFLLLFGILFLCGCTVEEKVIVSTNNFRQTDYDYNCLDGTKTFSQIIVCLNMQDKAEKNQNRITNELIDEK